MESFFTSVEFYIILFMLAIFLVGWIGRDNNRDEVLSYIYKSTIAERSEPGNGSQLYVEALANGNLMLIHRNIAVSEVNIPAIAISISGNDIKIVEKVEKITAVDDNSELFDAIYILDCLKAKKYHLYFESTFTGTYTATSIKNEAPFHVTSEFKL